MYNRLLSLDKYIEEQHLLFLGPRQTGKSTFLKQYLENALYIDLLNGKEYLTLSQQPEKLEERIRHFIQNYKQDLFFIVIDEIQKLPFLLNEVQRLIGEFPQVRFICTGSSARKLRRSGVNLLGGRAAKLNLYPIVSKELESWPEKNHKIEDLLVKGGLPAVLQAKNFENFLESYCTKKKISKFFKILFFDVGVANILKGTTTLQPKTTEFGRQLEHLVYCEIKAALEYLQIKGQLFYWRERTTGYEVDFIIEKRGGDIIAIEVKGTNLVSKKDLKGLYAFEEAIGGKKNLKKICVSSENFARTTEDGIEVPPYAEFFKKLWSNQILS